MVALAPTLKSVRGPSDKTENKKRQSICLVKSVNLPLQEKNLVFIEVTWVDPFSVNDGFCGKKYTSLVVHQMLKGHLAGWRCDRLSPSIIFLVID